MYSRCDSHTRHAQVLVCDCAVRYPLELDSRRLGVRSITSCQCTAVAYEYEKKKNETVWIRIKREQIFWNLLMEETDASDE